MNTHYVYLTCNIINYKLYVGITKKTIAEGYIGSGANFLKDVKKFGKCFFTRQDLFFGSEEEASKMEAYYVDLYDAVKSEKFYNMKGGGHHGHHGPEVKAKISRVIREKYTDPIYRKKIKAAAKARDNSAFIKSSKRDKHGDLNPMFGKKRSEEFKQNLSAKKKGIAMNLTEAQRQKKRDQVRLNAVFMGKKTKLQKAKNRWSSLKKEFSKEPIVSQDLDMMHTYFGVHESLSTFDDEKLKQFLDFRFKFLNEELTEGLEAIKEKNPDEVVDSLIDLIVIAVGTLNLFQVDFKKAWYEVLKANMEKQVGIKPKGRENPLGLPDLIKPPLWQAPSHADNVGLLSRVFK